MTNAEKYLKDGVKEEFIKEINAELDISFDQFNVEEWLNEPAKPTLTEDERVILRNIGKDYSRIYRNYEGNIFVYNKRKIAPSYATIGIFSHLFQFIKERRRILYRGTVERRIKVDWQGLREDFKQKHKERVAKTPQRIEYTKQELKKHSINAELKNEQTGQFNIKAGTHTITYYCSTGKILVDNKPYEQRGIKYAVYKAKKLERRRI